MASRFAGDAKFHDDQVAGVNFALDGSGGPFQVVTFGFNLQPPVLARNSQVRRPLCGDVFVVRVVVESTREVEHSPAAFHDADLIAVANESPLSIHSEYSRTTRITDMLGKDSFSIDINLEIVSRTQFVTELDVVNQSEDCKGGVFG